MSNRNQISVSPSQGEHSLLVNGFEIRVVPVDDNGNLALEFCVFRKGTYVLTCGTLQQAVKWCEV